MGLGTFGGGTGVVRYLVEEGAVVTVTDLRGEAELQKTLAVLRQSPSGAQPVRYVLGEHREEDFRETELVVVNPAVPRENEFLGIARNAGVKLTSEMRLFWERNPARVIGVTGSNGKSTTTAMTFALLEAAGKRCRLGGNIGKSLLPELKEIKASDWVVLELSSFQLEDLDVLQAGPDVGVVTNFTANHLDRHGTLEAYRKAKQTLLRWQRDDQIAVLNGDDPDVREWEGEGKRVVLRRGGSRRGGSVFDGWW
jgi:UDP-N-acetylmuramoylalanine--D-glutamate ligase